jgi:hypothetical protein
MNLRPADLELARVLWERAVAKHPGRVRIDIEVFIGVARDLARERGLAGRPTELVTHAVRTLRDLGVLSLPSDRTASVLKKNYDRRCDPPIPLFVTIQREAAERAPAPRREHPWHPDLDFLVRERRLECPDV